MICVGFDTSNYTSSVAWFDGLSGANASRLLPVKAGELGLRQSEALFSHIKRLPELSDGLFAHLDPAQLAAVGVSTRPRAVEGSYMPCFLAGESQARVLASALHLPLYEFSHQQGHIAAVLWSAGRLDLLGSEFLAWHLSGGTTELLLVRSTAAGEIDCEKIGGTTDISAGQLIDRTGQLLGLDFPAGKALDALACQGTGNGKQGTDPLAAAHSVRHPVPRSDEASGIRHQASDPLVAAHSVRHPVPLSDEASGIRHQASDPPVAPAICRPLAPAQTMDQESGNVGTSIACPPLGNRDFFRVKVHGTEFSLSGVQNQVQNYFAKGASEAETAYFALRSVIEAVKKATKNARTQRPLPVVFSGGVASNSMLRRLMPEAIFGAPQYSTDNAMGVAVLTWLRFRTTP